MITFAIGDVHGCLNELETLVKKCKEYANNQKYKFIFTGDYCDRGPDTKGVIDYIINLQNEVETIALCGNHDAMFYSFIHKKISGYETIHNCESGDSYHNVSWESYIKNKLDIDSLLKHAQWIKSLPVDHEDKYRYYVHAGVQPLHNEKTSNEMKLWVREQFLLYKRNFHKLIVHGHTVIDYDPLFQQDFNKKIIKLNEVSYNNNRPFIPKHNNRVNIDGGCCFGGHLICAIFNDDNILPIDYISVKNNKEIKCLF